MNRLWRLLVMPWVASPPYTRLIAALAVGGSLVVASTIAVAGLTHARTHWSHAFILALGFAVWSLWSSCLATNLQLARDARDLCVPGIPRGADRGLLLFAALSIGLPTLACWALGAPPLLAMATFALAAALGLAYMLLSFYIGLPVVLVVFIALTTHGLSAVVAGWWMLIPALAAFDVWRWWRLRTVASVHKEGLDAAAVFYCYRRDAMRNGGWHGLSQTFLQNPVKHAISLDLRGIGPRRPVDSLRLALGGFGMPKSLAARLQDLWRLLALLLVFALFLLALQLFGPDGQPVNATAIRTHWIPSLLVYGGVATSVIAVTAFASRVRALWRKPDAELPLLALLPGLGKPDATKRTTILASLVPPAVFLAITGVVLLAGAIIVHATAWAYVSIALCGIGAFALIVAATLESLGGRPMHTVAYVLLYGALMALSSLILSISLPTDQYQGPHPGRLGIPPAWLVAAWGLFLLMLCVLAFRGWRELRKRPHTFLANAP
ncbi:MAG: hypothetical protein EPN36_15420 [Rhodanobacteraceae bacterium]|nr:MAG: hypothetical protein EPN36_15420 [Rhodanobacteraceae bacterium]